MKKIKQFYISLFILICFQNENFAQYKIDYNLEIKQCYNLILALRIDEAQLKLKQIKATDGNNLAIIHLENYIDFFVLFISEDSAEFNKRYPNKSNRTNALDKVKLKDPHLNFIKAEVLLQWALIHIKFDDKIKAASNILEAYKLLEQNKKDYPKFIDNNKSLSIIHALAESLPNSVRKIFGIKGSISLGKLEIESLADHIKTNKNYLYKEEVIAIYSYILFYQLNQKQKAIKIFEDFDLNHSISPLSAFLKASMYLRNGSNDKTLAILQELRQDPRALPFHYLDFMKGRSLLYKQDPTAITHLRSFVDNFRGKHFIKEAYQKIAWYELSMNNDLAKYKSNMALCTNKGDALVDEDKQAMREAKSKVIPNAILLKSRILYDGGYFSRSQAVLIKNAQALSSNKTNQIEFNYRMGRIFQSLLNYPEAINYLKVAITNGGKENYYAANSALQLGFIHEELKQYKNAEYYFNLCLAQNPPEYKASMHQKAKSGLQRVRLSK